jgi:multidrug efflux pump
MKFTDTFINKPVLACVVSLLILVLGVRALTSLQVRQYPKTENATVTVSTTYFGANPDVIAGFITTPMETAIAQAQGIDYMTSTSVSGVSTIVANLRLNYDSNRALNEINTKVQSVINQLPKEAQQPTLSVAVGDTIDSMYIGFYSTELETNKITDYLVRVVQPKLQSLPGVQQAELLGTRQFALRAWLDPQRLASVGVTAEDVYTALGNNNYISAVGTTKGQMVSVDLTAGTDLHSVDEFKQLVVKQVGTSIVRLEDVANVVLGAEDYNSAVAFDGKKSVFIGIKVAPDANLLTVASAIRSAFPEVQSQLPSGLTGEIVYDSTKFVNSSISEVEKTLIEALLIVTVVIFLFLGSPRAVLIPLIAMPLSLIGAFFVMQLLGYSINLLTLLALVLAIGLVVDDAIIVVENVDRHMREGMTPLQASLVGARELAGPIIAISVVLVAVYVPIGFQGGLTGALFSEFAFTLAGAVAVSAVIALTLSPMMTAAFLNANHSESRLVKLIDRNFEWFTDKYLRGLRGVLSAWVPVVVFGFVIFGLLFIMFSMAKQELAPQEDQGIVLALNTAAATSTIQQMGLYSDQVLKIAQKLPEYDHIFQFDGVPTPNKGITGVILKPWDERARIATPIQQELQQKYAQVAGANIFAFQPPSLPGNANGLPVQFVIRTTEPFSSLYDISTKVVSAAQATGKFFVLDNDLKIDKPQTRVIIDKDKVATLGLSLKDVGSALGAMLGGGYVNYFSIAGRSYKVIPQVQRSDRLNANQLDDYYINVPGNASGKTPNGGVIPASTVATLKTETQPQSINHFQQLNSATIGAVYGGTQGDALAAFESIAKDILPNGYFIDYAGQSRQFKNESGGFLVTVMLAAIIVFLTLAAQFESFRDPLVVMMSVPMAIFGAMIFIFLDFASMNIYTKVGIVTLMGLIAKHGILIVQFANDQQALGHNKLEAIQIACRERLRPILMTTFAMVFGVLPLVIASGAGAVGRHDMGLVIFTGMSIGTLFTLFVVPAMYLFIAADHSKSVKNQRALPADGSADSAPPPQASHA